MKSRQLIRQQGAGVISIMLILAIAVFLGLFAFKITPHYMENWTINKIADDLAANPTILEQPRSKIYQYIDQAYRTNNLWDVRPEDTIRLTKDPRKGYVVNVEYEKRANLFHNIDVVTRFSKTASASL